MSAKTSVKAVKKSVSSPKTAPVGREQESKKAATVTGAGETSVPHANSDEDFDFGSESDLNAIDAIANGLDRSEI